MADMIEQRLNELEVRMMEQDQSLQDLSDVVKRQWQDIEQLQTRLKAAASRIDILEEQAPGNDDGGAPPPHY
jgi:SlyX protein